MNGIGDYFDLALSIVRPMHTDAIRAAQRELHEVHPTRSDFDKAMQEVHPNRADFEVACARASEEIRTQLRNAPVFRLLDLYADQLSEVEKLSVATGASIGIAPHSWRVAASKVRNGIQNPKEDL